MSVNNYWDAFYKRARTSPPSPFCAEVLKTWITPEDHVLELGCGDGRDGTALSSRAARYVGVDASEQAIVKAKKNFQDKNIPPSEYELTVGNFSTLDFHIPPTNRLVVYSRFSLHADSEAAEDALLANLKRTRQGRLLVLVEARTIYDSLYGQGQRLARNTFMTDHSRRFLDPREFLLKVQSNFDLFEYRVSSGLATFGNEDPVVMRIAFGRDEDFTYARE